MRVYKRAARLWCVQCEHAAEVLRCGDLPVGAVQRKLVELLEEDDDDEDRWCRVSSLEDDDNSSDEPDGLDARYGGGMGCGV
jgi:hypothetical protein